jgi:hypothetical protein
MPDKILEEDHPRIISAKKIFSSETTVPIATKLLWNDPWMAPFQIYVR